MTISKTSDWTYNVLDTPLDELPEAEKKVRLEAATHYSDIALWTLLKFAESSAKSGQNKDRVRSIIKEAKAAIAFGQELEKEMYTSLKRIAGDPIFFFSEMALIKVAKIEALGDEKTARATLESAIASMENIRTSYFQSVYKDPADYERNYIRCLISAAKIEGSFDKEVAYKTIETAQKTLKSLLLSDLEEIQQMETRITKAESKLRKM